MPRSLQVSETQKDKLKYALIRQGYATQKLFAEKTKLSLSTINKFFNYKPIDKLNFIEICHQLELDWDVITASTSPDISFEEIDRRPQDKPIPKGQGRIRISLEATIDKFNKEMLDEFIKIVQEKALDASFKLRKIEEGSLIFEFEGSEEGCKRFTQLFKSGKLQEILRINLLNVDLVNVDLETSSLNLKELLQNNFSNAVKAGWQNIEDILSIQQTSLAFRTLSIRQAKRFDFENQLSILFVLSMQEENEQIKIYLDFYPAYDSESYLPENLKIIIQSEAGQTVFEKNIEESNPNLKLDINAEHNETFLVQISLGKITFRESLIA